MKRRALYIFSLLLLLTACTKKPPGVYDSHIGTWYISAAYKDGQSTNWLPIIIAVDSCVRNTNITFAEDSTFWTRSSCNSGTTHGVYEIRGDSIFATDSTKTEVFLFADSCLFKNIEIHDAPVFGDFVCNLVFRREK